MTGASRIAAMGRSCGDFGASGEDLAAMGRCYRVASHSEAPVGAAHDRDAMLSMPISALEKCS